MDDELISKKDLLAQTGISYGQLYRWKRKGLIPEDWFMRKSTFTGQETFFPRDKMLARVNRILGMKDEDISLDDIADAVAPDLGEVSVTRAEAAERGLVSEAALEALAEAGHAEDPLRIGELVAGRVHDSLLSSGEASRDEGRVVVKALEEHYRECQGKECDLVFVRKQGVATACLVSASAEVLFESGARVVARVSLSDVIDELSARF
jgi:DNA-binding transcriptional MerR regulator